MNRYDMKSEYNHIACEDQVVPVEDSKGRWVRYEDAAALAAQVESMMKIVQDNVLIHISANTANISADAVESVNLDGYDAGYLNDFGGGNVGWWQDYIRSELAAAHDFYQSQLQEYADSIRQEKKL